MTPHANDKWLLWAERIDALRAVPRLIILAYYLFFIRAWFYVVDWFIVYDWSVVEGSETIALAIAGFPAIILGVLTGVLNTLTKSYWAGGRKWDVEDNHSE